MNFLDGQVKGLGPLAVGDPMDRGQKFQTIRRLEAVDQFTDLAEPLPCPGVILEDGQSLGPGPLGKLDGFGGVIPAFSITRWEATFSGTQRPKMRRRSSGPKP